MARTRRNLKPVKPAADPATDDEVDESEGHANDTDTAMATGGEAPACSKFSKPAEKAKAKAKTRAKAKAKAKTRAKAKAKTRAKAKAKAKSKSKASAKSKQALVDDEELEAARSEGRGSGTGSDGPDDPDLGNPATDEGKESESEGHDASDNGEALDDACSKPAGKAKGRPGRPKAKATAKSKSKPKAKSKRAQAANGAESSANKEDEAYREAKEAKAKAKRKAKAKAKPTADEADLEDIDTVESKVKGEVDDDGVSDGQCRSPNCRPAAIKSAQGFLVIGLAIVFSISCLLTGF